MFFARVALSGRYDKISFDDYSSAAGTLVYPSGVTILPGSQMTTTWRNGFFNNALQVRHDSLIAGIQFPMKSFDCFSNPGRRNKTVFDVMSFFSDQYRLQKMLKRIQLI